MLVFLEKKGKLLVSDLIGLIDVKDQIVINDLNALLYNKVFNLKSANSGIITPDFDKESQEIATTTTIEINKDFNPNNLKLNTVPLMIKKTKTDIEIDEENEKRNLANYQNMVLDAYVTRIMKGRIGQTTTHLFLVNETVRQIELFAAQPIQIKSRIEALIEKQLLKRKEGNYDQYEYIS